ncbi:nitroreductase family protein [Desulfovibrio sp. OttesenSCG-928-C14]|nr:nitroreductase family protein [Desulfovibrio sp. OttesenSCG-928-C14]
MPDTSPVLQTILERRSVRAFSAAPVEEEKIRQILLAGIYAPSGINKQPMRFLPLGPGDPKRAVFAEYCKRSRFVADAPMLVAVFLDKNKGYHALKDAQGMGACIQNMLLAARALGLGSVWVGEMFDSRERIMAELKFATAGKKSPNWDHLELHALVCLGYPAETPVAPKRADISEYVITVE